MNRPSPTRHFRIGVNGRFFDVTVQEVPAHGSGTSGRTSSVGAAASPQAAPPAPVPNVAGSAGAPSAPSLGGSATPSPSAAGSATISAPMSGTVVEVRVAEGDQVQPGDVVAVLSAMKMENDVIADGGGIVGSVFVSAGQTVQTGDPLVQLARG